MVRFGSFEFDVVTRRVQRGSEDIHLPPKAFELLGLLVDAAPRVMTKRELHARLWPRGAVTDATLVALIKQLRKALDDHDRRAPLIRTVHRIGYALEAEPVPAERAVASAREAWLQLGQRRLPLCAGENVIGRDPAAHVRLDDPVVSRRHARIVVSAAEVQLEDLASKNGTFLDGRRLDADAEALRDGSEVAFGTLTTVFHKSASGMPTLTHFDP